MPRGPSYWNQRKRGWGGSEEYVRRPGEELQEEGLLGLSSATPGRVLWNYLKEAGVSGWNSLMEAAGQKKR